MPNEYETLIQEALGPKKGPKASRSEDIDYYSLITENLDPKRPAPEAAQGFWAEFNKSLEAGGLQVASAAPGTAAAIAARRPASMAGFGIGFRPDQPVPEQTADEKELINRLNYQAQTLYEDAKREALQRTTEGFAGYAGQVLGQTLPFMAAAGLAGWAVGPAGAFAVAAAVEGDGAYRDAIAEGATEEQAQLERIVVGTLNGIIEQAQVSGVLKVAEGAGGEAIQALIRGAKQKSLSKMAKAGKKLGATQVKTAIQEGLEEASQDLVSQGMAVLDGRKNLDLVQTAEAAAGGAFAGSVLGFAGSVGQSIVSESKVEMNVIDENTVEFDMGSADLMEEFGNDIVEQAEARGEDIVINLDSATNKIRITRPVEMAPEPSVDPTQEPSVDPTQEPSVDPTQEPATEAPSIQEILVEDPAGVQKTPEAPKVEKTAVPDIMTPELQEIGQLIQDEQELDGVEISPKHAQLNAMAIIMGFGPLQSRKTSTDVQDKATAIEQGLIEKAVQIAETKLQTDEIVTPVEKEAMLERLNSLVTDSIEVGTALQEATDPVQQRNLAVQGAAIQKDTQTLVNALHRGGSWSGKYFQSQKKVRAFLSQDTVKPLLLAQGALTKGAPLTAQEAASLEDAVDDFLKKDDAYQAGLKKHKEMAADKVLEEAANMTFSDMTEAQKQEALDSLIARAKILMKGCYDV